MKIASSIIGALDMQFLPWPVLLRIILYSGFWLFVKQKCEGWQVLFPRWLLLVEVGISTSGLQLEGVMLSVPARSWLTHL